MTSLALSNDAFVPATRRSTGRRLLQTVRQVAPPAQPVAVRRDEHLVDPPRAGGWWLVGVAIALHAAVVFVATNGQPGETKEAPKPLKLTLSRTEPAEPPPPPPPPELKPQPPTRKPVPNQPVETTPVQLPATDSTAGDEPAVAVAAAPVAPPAPPAPPPVPEKITEARGGIGYLNNPPPEYPEVAQTQGKEGRVVLLVKVGIDGRPLQIDVKTSSGHRILDEAAQRTVQGWRFAPAKRGETPIEGLATVPIVFKL